MLSKGIEKDAFGKLLKSASDSPPNSLLSPVINHIDTNIQRDKIYIFEYETYDVNKRPGPLLRELLVKYSESFISFSPQVFILTNLKNITKLIEEFAKNNQELGIINYSIIAVEKGYILSNWLKRI